MNLTENDKAIVGEAMEHFLFDKSKNYLVDTLDACVDVQVCENEKGEKYVVEGYAFSMSGDREEFCLPGELYTSKICMANMTRGLDTKLLVDEAKQYYLKRSKSKI